MSFRRPLGALLFAIALGCAAAAFAQTPAPGSSAPSDADAQVALATRYRTGDGVPQDFAEARRLYGLAASQKNGAALRLLGDMEKAGEGKRRSDPDKALELWRQASAAGDPHAAIQVADRLFEKATGTRAPSAMPINLRLSGHFYADKLTETARWYVAAAKQDDRPDVSDRALKMANVMAALIQAVSAVTAKMREHELPHEIP